MRNESGMRFFFLWINLKLYVVVIEYINAQDKMPSNILNWDFTHNEFIHQEQHLQRYMNLLGKYTRQKRFTFSCFFFIISFFVLVDLFVRTKHELNM